MNPRTVQFYGGHAADLTRQYAAAPTVASRFFPVTFTPGSRILDIGCGLGPVDTATRVGKSWDDDRSALLSLQSLDHFSTR
jgi:2-polyprenyl-3-methyl-5-hydroxy-6-metoxy-1,4-benzoquinol methylase